MPVVFLHGFAATARHWDGVIAALPPGRFTPIALSISDADPLAPDGVTRLVRDCTQGRFVLVGYSMGGRLALHTALAIPERIERLVLVSAAAGIEDAGARADRRAADEALAEEIEHGSISSFIERWRAVPLFAQDPAWVAEAVAADQLRCSPATLAGCLRGLGAGAMTPMWDRLGELRMPVAVLAGADDVSYEQAGRRLAAGIGDASFRALAGVRHRVALQAPAVVAAAIATGVA
jgi:2-succinyl-6-hydroxy-2,4-cyclohexadiene-1-carboxylate synthase